MPKILVINSHPSPNSFGDALCKSYLQGAISNKHETRELILRDLNFDPILRDHLKNTQPLEPDLQAAQADILWAEHLVIQFPNWWGSTPALLKGFIDRTFTSGFAFQYHKTGSGWDKLLAGRTARIIVTMDAPGWWDRFAYRASSRRAISHATLKFCGIKPVRISTISSLRKSSDQDRTQWLNKIQTLGAQAL